MNGKRINEKIFVLILQKAFIYSLFQHLMKFNVINKAIKIQYTESLMFIDETQNPEEFFICCLRFNKVCLIRTLPFFKSVPEQFIQMIIQTPARFWIL